MLPFISSFLKTTFFVFLTNDYLQQKYPEKYNEILINISLKILFLFSKSQITIYKINRYVVDNYNQVMIKNPKINIFIENCINYYNRFTKNTNSIHNIEFISNGKIIYSVSKENIINDAINFQMSYDFVICSDYNLTENTYINKKIQKSIENKNFDYELSDISFILSEIIIGDKIIKVDFKTENYNYYIVNNIFDCNFILYFLCKHYISEIKDIPIDSIKQFKMKIIDYNVDTKNYDNLVNIQIQKKGCISI